MGFKGIEAEVPGPAQALEPAEGLAERVKIHLDQMLAPFGLAADESGLRLDRRDRNPQGVTEFRPPLALTGEALAEAQKQARVFIQFAGYWRGPVGDPAVRQSSDGWQVEGGERGGERVTNG